MILRSSFWSGRGDVGSSGASLLTELSNQVGFRNYRFPSRAGMAGFLIAGSMSYAVGFFAGKMANYSHVSEKIEKGAEKVIQQVKKL